MKTKTDKQKLEAIYDMRERMVREIEHLYEISSDVDNETRAYLSGQKSSYSLLIDFLDDVKEGKEV